MADIKEIDYDMIITKASQIANSANNMQESIKSAFNEIDKMREVWFGQSYDNFINTVNVSITGLNKVFEVTVSDIPHEIAAKARSFASANQSTVSTSLSDQVAIMLTDLTKTNKGSKLRFQSDNVTAAQSTIKAKFEEAASYAEEAYATSDSLTEAWNSISGDSNIRELKNAFNRVKTIMNSLSSALDGQISQQATTINALEAAAEAVEAVHDAAENLVDSAVDAAAAAVQNIQQSASDLWNNLTGKN